jgi:peptidoglycan biosynthesis protein MviN/MurJ (putative lipid II flippase)
MRRLTTTLLLNITLLALFAPSALAQASGEGSYGAADDKVITSTAFILIAFFPLFVLLVSLLQWRLEKRKDARKAAVKSAGGDARWRGGW